MRPPPPSRLVAPRSSAGAPLPAVTLTILHTSDLHGRVHPHDALADEDLGEGLARVAAAVKAIRAEGNPTLLLDSGRHDPGRAGRRRSRSRRGGDGERSDRARHEPRRLRRDGRRQPRVRLRPRRASRSRARRRRFPWLSANTLDADGAPPFHRTSSARSGGVRVGILGLVTPHVPSWESPRLIAGLRFGDTVPRPRRARSDPARPGALRPRRGPDAPGLRTRPGDRARSGATRREPGVRARDRGARASTSLLAGHAHAVVAPRQIGTTWVSEPGRWGNTLTRFDVTLEKAGAPLDGSRTSTAATFT